MQYKDRPRVPGQAAEPSSVAADADPRRAAAIRRRLIQRKAQNQKTQKTGKKKTGELEAADADAGERVAPHVQKKVEAATGADLSAVRVHTGAASAEAARSVEAKAYTVGQDVHFNAGQYRPGSAEGDRLIAHELVHTVQQGVTPAEPQHKLEVSEPGDSSETEADEIADRALAEKPGQKTAAAAPKAVARQIQREPEGAGAGSEAPATAGDPKVEEEPGGEKDKAGGEPIVAKLELNVDVQSADPTHLSIRDAMQMHVGHAWISMQYIDPQAVPASLPAPTQGMLKGGGTAMGLWPLVHRATDWPGGKPSAEVQKRVDKGETPGAGRDADPKHTGASLNPLHSFVPGRVEEPDDAHAAKGSQMFELTQKQVDSMMAYVDGHRSANYSLFEFNCVHFATQAVAAAGHSAPSATQYGIVMPNGLYDSFVEMHRDGADDVSLSPQKKDEQMQATALR